MQAGVMRFRVSDVKNAGRLDAETTENPLLLFGPPPTFIYYEQPLSVSAHAVYSGAGIEIKGAARMQVAFDCARCNVRFTRDFNVPFELIGSLESQEIDADPEIKDAFLLEFPLIPVCKQDCKGLCATCGVNLNFKTCQCPTTPEHLAWKKLDDIRFS
jgi:uncharacterized protein